MLNVIPWKNGLFYILLTSLHVVCIKDDFVCQKFVCKHHFQIDFLLYVIAKPEDYDLVHGTLKDYCNSSRDGKMLVVNKK